MEERIVIDPAKLEELKKIPFYKTFSRFDDEGKVDWLGMILDFYFNKKYVRVNIKTWPKDEDKKREFCRLLYEAVGVSGLWAMLSTVSGSGTSSWSEGKTVEDIIQETERILNDEEYRKRVNTSLSKNLGMYYELRKKEKLAA